MKQTGSGSGGPGRAAGGRVGRSWLVPMLIAALGVGATVVVHGVLVSRERSLAVARFQTDAVGRSAAIDSELADAVDALHAVRAFYEASELVEPEEFERFGREILRRHTTVLALDWVPRVSAGRGEEFVASAREVLGVEYAILECDETGRMVAAEGRPWHYPILYACSAPSARAMLGFDHGSEAGLLSAMEMSAWSNAPVASARRKVVRLAEGIGDRGGVTVYLPVFEGGVAPSAEHLRLGAVSGFLAATMRLSDLLAAAIQGMPAGQMDVHLIDMAGGGGVQELLYSTAPGVLAPGDAFGRASGSEVAEGVRQVVRYSTLGRDWVAVFDARSLKPYYPEGRASTWALGFGFVLTALALVYVQMLRVANARSERLVEQRTRELRERGERLRAILQTAPDAIIVADERGVVESVNPATERMFGYCAEELIGRELTALMPERLRELHRAGLRRYLQNGPGRTVGGGVLRTYGLRKDGLEFPIELSVGEVRLGEGRRFTGIIRDVTERKRAEDAIQSMNALLEERVQQRTEELQRMVEELAQFASIASHDLQEPLRKVLVFGDRLRQQYEGALGDRGRDYLSRMLNAADRMSSLLNDLLELTRVTSKGRPFERVDLGDVVRGVLTDLEVALQESGGSVEVGDLPVIDSDATQMRQLFQNLLSNALKFRCGERLPRVTIEAESPVQAGGGGGSVCRLVVRDNGIGFDPRYAGVIFEPFHRLHGRSEYEGSGMGLAICRKIVERHGGRIAAEGRAGEGASFVIELPLRQGATGEQPCHDAKTDRLQSSSPRTTRTTA
ncbi:MAG TPA: PAS domain S-box protein [Phycisphaerales bacterium]|nr:PAS domain S-box protein [Phycisphaerales bacterium]